eukprot:jgi/Bigna1/131198/aug1.13_g5906
MSAQSTNRFAAVEVNGSDLVVLEENRVGSCRARGKSLRAFITGKKDHEDVHLLLAGKLKFWRKRSEKKVGESDESTEQLEDSSDNASDTTDADGPEWVLAPVGKTKRALRKHNKRARKAERSWCSLIHQSCDATVRLNHLNNVEEGEGRKAGNALKPHFDRITPMTELQLAMKLIDLQMKGEDFTGFCATLEDFTKRIKEAELKLEDVFLGVFCKGLSPALGPAKNIAALDPAIRTLKAAKNKTLAHLDLHSVDKKATEEVRSAAAFAVEFLGRCHRCGKTGHERRDCPSKRKSEGRDSKGTPDKRKTEDRNSRGIPVDPDVGSGRRKSLSGTSDKGNGRPNCPRASKSDFKAIKFSNLVDHGDGESPKWAFGNTFMVQHGATPDFVRGPCHTVMAREGVTTTPWCFWTMLVLVTPSPPPSVAG